METEEPGVRSSQRRAVEDRAVAWLAARRAMLDPRHTHSDTVLFTRKALIETAFLVGLRARLDDAPLDGGYAAILQQVADVAGRPSYREMVAQDEEALLLYAGTYAALRLCGREDLEFRRIIQQAAAGGYAAAFERVPYRQLDLLHTLYLCGIEHDLPAIDAVLPFTLLCQNPNVLKLADRDIYAVTHTIFYATDFGRRTPVWPGDYSSGSAVELLEALLILAEARTNADLVGELLCCLYCLGVNDSDAADRAWAFLESVQEDNGRVNGPEGIIHPGIDKGNEDFRHWAEGYHTTIVTALAGLLRRTPRRRTGPRPNLPTAEVALTAPLRRAVVWLCDQSLEQDPRVGIAGVTAAAIGAAAIQEHHLARPALEHYAAVLSEAPRTLWQEQGMEVAGEFALALHAAGANCPSLNDFLKATADVVSSLRTVPADIADGLHRLISLGFLGPSAAAVIPQQSTPYEQRSYPLQAASSLCEARKTYNLGQLAGTIRTLAQGGWGRHRITQDAVALLLAQQNITGAFGYPTSDNKLARGQAQRSWTRSAVAALAIVVRASHKEH
ncbi:DUF6895 family protein [Streptomyces herbicida]|uniref:DUF6895 family protein n=1 Tax=Streptomyces herbicida TaxID=3065675 RepID=UPI00292DA447|nr:hypothetical protein [Streptomyces sp. NEAU-HV9]